MKCSFAIICDRLYYYIATFMLVNLGTVLLYDFAFSLNSCSATCLQAAFEKQAEGTFGG